MIPVIVLLSRDLIFVMAIIFSGLLVSLWTGRKSAYCGAADGKKPSGIEDGKNCYRDYELLMPSQIEFSPSLTLMQPGEL